MYLTAPVHTRPNRRAVTGSRPGVTLVEMIIALAVLLIGITALMQTFGLIQRSLQQSRNRTLASNLAQEKMQIIKQKSYYQIIVTTDPGHNSTDFAPEVLDYDKGFFPPESITEGGTVYTRYTYVQSITEDSGNINELAPNVPDVGMKRVTVSVVWDAVGGKRKVTLRSIVSNPDTVMANVIFKGVVQTTGAVAIGGAYVGLVEGAAWSDTTDGSGRYNINATPGNFTMMASARGYYSQLKSVVIAAGNTLTTDFSMVKIPTGYVKGYPWITDHLVISQIVGSTISPSGYDQEYVEVFNPTTYTWTMDGQIGLNFQRAVDAGKRNIQLTYLTDDLPPGGYYLFANTGTVRMFGGATAADAVWSDANSVMDFPYFGSQKNIIPVTPNDGGAEGSGAVELYRLSNGTRIDAVGWDKTSYPAPFSETQAIQQAVGLERDELYARLSSTGDISGVNWNYGPAYDSGNNSVDFYDYNGGISTAPHNASAWRSSVSGTPAVGAVVSCTDGLSASTEAVLVTNASPHQQSYAYFSLPEVTTGTWMVFISSGANAYPMAASTLTVSAQGSSVIFPATSTFLTEYRPNALITGKITDVFGAALSGIWVTAGGSTPIQTGSDGRYRLTVQPGSVNVIANPSGGGSSSYVTASSNSIQVDVGEVHSGVNFVLYRGGRVTGFISRDGSSALPGVAVAILDYNGIARDQQVSGGNGYFTSVILSTGLYTVFPVIGALEASSPSQSTVTLATPGATVFVSTFTIAGALGSITGSVTAGGSSLKSGALIVVTTVSLTGNPASPPSISSSTLTGPPYYIVSSIEDGTYRAEVRGSTNPAYKVYAFYTVPLSTYTAIYMSSAPSVPVTAGQTTTGINFSW